MTEKVTITSSGEQGQGDAWGPMISGDGRFVSFYWVARFVRGGDRSGAGLWVHDRVTKTTERADVNSAGEVANAGSTSPSISADGRFIVFSSGATNLTPEGGGAPANLFLRDREVAKTEQLISCARSPSRMNPYPSISADGRFVAFMSDEAAVVAGDANGLPDVFVHDRGTTRIARVNVSATGAEADAWGYAPVISADGRFVAFVSPAGNLVPGDTNGHTDIFVARNPLAP